MATSINAPAMYPAHSVFKRYLLTTGLPADVCTTYAEIYRREVMPFLRDGAKATPSELKVRPASIVLSYAYEYIANHADELHGSLPAAPAYDTERSKEETSMAESEREKSALATNIKELEERLQTERRKYETELAESEREKSALATNIKELEARLQTGRRKYETSMAESAREKSTLATMLNARLKAERRKYETELAELKARLQDERHKYETEILRATAESVERESLLEKNIASLQKQLSVQERAVMKLAVAQYVEKARKKEESDDDYEPDEEEEEEPDEEEEEEVSSSNTCRLLTTALIMLALLGLVFLPINPGMFEKTLNDIAVPAVQHARYIYAYTQTGLKQALDDIAVPHARYLYAYAQSGLSIIIKNHFSR